MRKLTELSLVFAVVSLVSLTTVDRSIAAGPFADKNLEAAIRKELKKDGKAPLKDADLKNVYFLRAGGGKITSLKGLEKCTNLASADLADNAIVDLGPMSGLLHLQKLVLSNNRVSNVAPLAKLVKLQYLDLSGNRIETVDGLKGLTALTTLYLSKNRLKSIKPLAGLTKIWSLYLNDNQLTDIAPLAKLKWLSSLDLRRNAISNLSALSGMTELRYTFLEGNKIADLSVLVSMAKKDAAGVQRFAPYWRLYLSGNPLTTAAKTGQVAELKKLGVRVALK